MILAWASPFNKSRSFSLTSDSIKYDQRGLKPGGADPTFDGGLGQRHILVGKDGIHSLHHPRYSGTHKDRHFTD